METNGLVVAHLPYNGSGEIILWADGNVVAFINGTISEIWIVPDLNKWAIFVSPLGSIYEVSIFADRFVKGER